MATTAFAAYTVVGMVTNMLNNILAVSNTVGVLFIIRMRSNLRRLRGGGDVWVRLIKIFQMDLHQTLLVNSFFVRSSILP